MSVLRKLLSKKYISNKVLALTSNFKKTYFSNYIQHSDLPDEEIPKCSVDEFLFLKTGKWHNRFATVSTFLIKHFKNSVSIHIHTNMSNKIFFEFFEIFKKYCFYRNVPLLVENILMKKFKLRALILEEIYEKN